MNKEELDACIWLTNIITKSEKDKKNIKILLNYIDRLQKENKELKEQDLTIVYMSGFYDGEKKWQDKIKDKIKELKETIDNLSDKMIKAMERKRIAEFDEYNEMEKRYSFVLKILKDLLKE